MVKLLNFSLFGCLYIRYFHGKINLHSMSVLDLLKAWFGIHFAIYLATQSTPVFYTIALLGMHQLENANIYVFVRNVLMVISW
jgi:hypothetical protein